MVEGKQLPAYIILCTLRHSIHETGFHFVKLLQLCIALHYTTFERTLLSERVQKRDQREPEITETSVEKLGENTDRSSHTYQVYEISYFYFLRLYCPNGISPTGNSGCFPWGKPAATESRYPTYGACWVFECFHYPTNSDLDYRIFNVHTQVNAWDCTRGCMDTRKRESALKLDSGRKIPCRTGESNLRQWRDGPLL